MGKCYMWGSLLGWKCNDKTVWSSRECLVHLAPQKGAHFSREYLPYLTELLFWMWWWTWWWWWPIYSCSNILGFSQWKLLIQTLPGSLGSIQALSFSSCTKDILQERELWYESETQGVTLMTEGFYRRNKDFNRIDKTGGRAYRSLLFVLSLWGPVVGISSPWGWYFGWGMNVSLFHPNFFISPFNTQTETHTNTLMIRWISSKEEYVVWNSILSWFGWVHLPYLFPT